MVKHVVLYECALSLVISSWLDDYNEKIIKNLFSKYNSQSFVEKS